MLNTLYRTENGFVDEILVRSTYIRKRYQRIGHCKNTCVTLSTFSGCPSCISMTMVILMQLGQPEKVLKVTQVFLQ